MTEKGLREKIKITATEANKLGKDKGIIVFDQPGKIDTDTISPLIIPTDTTPLLGAEENVTQKITAESKEKHHDTRINIPKDPNFISISFVPEKSVGNVLPDYNFEYSQILGLIVKPLENEDVVRIEYIGHGAIPRTNGSQVDHVFYFRSQLRNPKGEIINTNFYPSDPKSKHVTSKGGNLIIHKWFLKLLELETGNRNIENEEWVPSTQKNGYYSFRCSAQVANAETTLHT